MSKIPVFEKTLPREKFGVDVVLIDADILRYEIGAVQLPHPYIKGGKIPAPTSFIEGLVQQRIDSILASTRAKSFLLFLTGAGNFRFDIAKQEPYKGNREDFEKPHHWKTVDKYLRTNFKIIDAIGNEADDLLAEIQELHVQKFRCGDKTAKVTAIASRDKDLRTQEGWHYSWACGEGQPEKPLYYIPFIEGKRFFFEQMLKGDNTDNIIGCGVRKEVKWGGKMMLRRKGVGEKAAQALLKNAKTLQEMYEIIKDQYHLYFEQDKVKEVMLENARLLYIGQEKDKQFDWSWMGIEE